MRESWVIDSKVAPLSLYLYYALWLSRLRVASADRSFVFTGLFTLYPTDVFFRFPFKMFNRSSRRDDANEAERQLARRVEQSQGDLFGFGAFDRMFREQEQVLADFHWR